MVPIPRRDAEEEIGEFPGADALGTERNGLNEAAVVLHHSTGVGWLASARTHESNEGSVKESCVGGRSEVSAGGVADTGHWEGRRDGSCSEDSRQ